jgi:hypothetical protein
MVFAVVLGKPIRQAVVYSSTTMVLGGREHHLPNCTEELCRTGEKAFSMKLYFLLTRSLRNIPTKPISNSSKPL